MNKFMLSGNVAFEVTKTDIGEGRFYADVTVKTTNGRKDDNGKRRYDYITCRAWGQSADFAVKWCTPGTPIEVEGHITSYYVEGDDGKKSRRISFDAEKFSFCPKNWAEEGEVSAPAARHVPRGGFTEPDLDMPVPF